MLDGECLRSGVIPLSRPDPCHRPSNSSSTIPTRLRRRHLSSSTRQLSPPSSAATVRLARGGPFFAPSSQVRTRPFSQGARSPSIRKS